mgnify:CR=1 FL=1
MTKGTKHTAETIKKLKDIALRLGIYPPSRNGARLTLEQRKKLSDYWSGRPRGPRTEETKRKLSLAVKGFKHTEEVKLRISEKLKGKKPKNFGIYFGLKGINHPNWKGGITPINHKIRASLNFKLWRKAVFERDDYRCIGCGIKSEKGTKVILNADHIFPFFKFPRLRFDINNGRTLCVDCHKLTDTYKEKAKYFSIEGRPVIHLTQ